MSPEARSIKAIAFDAYGTLFDVHSVVSACEELYTGKGQSLSQLWRAKQLEYTWLLSLMGRYDDFWHVTERALTFACKSLELTCDSQSQQRLMGEYLRLDTYSEVPSSLAALSDYTKVILSNGAPDMLQAAVDNAGIARELAHVISIHEVRAYKPSASAYRLATQRLGLDASAICFVSSNSFDVIGASSFGFYTCWVNRQGAPLDELGITPDITVDSLTGLAGVFSAAS